MKIELAMRKQNGALVPLDEDGRELIAFLPVGKDVLVSVKTARSVRQHRLFFGLLNLLVQNCEAFGSVDEALVAVKIATREVETYIDPETGEVFYVPRSIAFASMDGARFSRLFERALFVITQKWLAGTDADALRAEVYAMVDGPAAIGERAA